MKPINRTSLLPALLLLASATSLLAKAPEKWQQMQRAVLEDQNLSTIKYLITKGGVDPNAPIGCGTFAPLDGAIAHKNVPMISLLLSLGAKPTEQQIVHAAFYIEGDVALKVVKMLRDAGAPANAHEYAGNDKSQWTTPLSEAVWRENEPLVTYLLRQPGIEVDVPNVDGYTPLMIAVEKGNQKLVNALLAAGADPKRKNSKGVDAANVATQVIAKQHAFIEQLTTVQ